MDDTKYHDLPPHTNRGAGCTIKNNMRALVDWFQVTLHNVSSLQDVKDLFGISELEMNERESGYYGYPNMVQSNNISIMWRGEDTYEFHVLMTGQGCRFFETVSTVDWITLTGYLRFGLKCNFTRVDLAVDDFSNLFSISTVRKKINNGEVVSKLKTVDDLRRKRLSDCDTIIDSLRFGSEQSRLLIRMYDKKMEREKEGKEVEENVRTWVRTEIQFRKEYSNVVVDQLYACNFDVGRVVKGHLKNYLRFVVKNKTDSNKRRWHTARWWTKFLGEVEKLKLSLSAPDRTVESTKRWHDNQVAPTFVMFDEIFGRERMYLYLDSLIDNNKDRLSDVHIQMIQDYKDAHEVLELKQDNINALRDSFNDVKNSIGDKVDYKKKLSEIYMKSASESIEKSLLKDQ